MYAWFRRIVVILFAIVVFGAGGVGWYIYVHFTDPATVRRLFLQYAERSLPGARVELASAEGRWIGGIRLRGLSVSALAEESEQTPFLRMESCVVVPDRERLFEGQLAIKRATLEGLELTLIQRADGSWNIAPWLGKSNFTPDAPLAIALRRARVTVVFNDPALGAQEFHDVDLDLEWNPARPLTWEGSVVHGMAERLITKGSIDPVARELAASVASAAPVELARLAAGLPPGFKAKLGPAELTGGQFLFRGSVTATGEAGGWRWEGWLDGKVRDGSGRHAALPYPVAKVESDFRLTGAELKVSRLIGECGPARFELAGSMPRWDPEAAHGSASCWNIPFSESVYRCLPIRLQQAWERVSPEGSADIHMTARRQEERWLVSGYADFHECATTFYRFPRRAEEVAGRAVLHPDGHLTLECQGRVGPGTARLVGSFAGIRTGAAMELTITGQDIVADDECVAALPESVQETLGKIRASATGDVVVRCARAEGEPAIDWKVDMDLAAPSCSCAWFPYPFTDVTGHLTVRRYRTEFRDFAGRAGSGIVRLDGQLVRTTDGNHLELSIDAKGVPLDLSLKAALPGETGRAWDALRPDGLVDVSCELIKPPGAPLDTRIRLHLPEGAITPVAFPYRLERFSGSVAYHQGEASWEEVEARHGPVLIRATGRSRVTPAGGVLALTDLACERLPIDQDLRAALPAGLGRVADFLQPDRPLSMSWKQLEIAWFEDRRRPVEYRFDGIVGCRAASLVPSVGVENLTGVVGLVGEGVGDRVRASGNLELESLRIASFAAERVSTPLEIDGQDIRMRNILGEIYGGKLYAQFLANTQIPGYESRITVSGASLGRYVRDVMPNSPPIDGVVQVELYSHGRGLDPRNAGGNGRLYIRQADIYRSPIIQEVIRLLNFQVPNGRAFEEVDCNFRLKDRLVLIDNLDLLGPKDVMGPSLSLFSDDQGWVNLDDRTVNLRLYPRWGKGRVRIPVLSAAVNGAADQLISIPVTGPISNPTLSAEPIPGLRRILELPFRQRPTAPFPNRSNMGTGSGGGEGRLR